SVRARVINGKVGGVEFSCPPKAPALHTHPDSLCAPGGVACEFVPVERRQYPSLADLHALKASGAPFDMIQYGPRDFWIYTLAPDAPPTHSSSAGHYASPVADTALPRSPLDSLDRLRGVLDSLLFARDLVTARIDSIEQRKGQVGRSVVVIPAGVYGAQERTPRRLHPLAFIGLLEAGAEVFGRIDHDSGGYDPRKFYVKKFAMHTLGGCAVEQLAESAHVPRWLAVAGTIAAAWRFEIVQGYPNKRDFWNGSGAALACASWGWYWR
ncbi:MAG: hypothetical protein HOQ26_19015, partial [Gemmatimonadaceae bacterium]|nr:hypothetical protein [Gemmatimonadaceae bacterium]